MLLYYRKMETVRRKNTSQGETITSQGETIEIHFPMLYTDTCDQKVNKYIEELQNVMYSEDIEWKSRKF